MMKKFTAHTRASRNTAPPMTKPLFECLAAIRNKTGAAMAASVMDKARWIRMPSAGAKDYSIAAGQTVAVTCLATAALLPPWALP